MLPHEGRGLTPHSLRTHAGACEEYRSPGCVLLDVARPSGFPVPRERTNFEALRAEYPERYPRPIPAGQGQTRVSAMMPAYRIPLGINARRLGAPARSCSDHFRFILVDALACLL